MKFSSLKIFTIQVLVLVASLTALKAEANQHIDRDWVRAVARDNCIPKGEENNHRCTTEFSTCTAEFERTMDGIFYGFCQGQNPELCNKAGDDLYDFSNKGYSTLVDQAITNFLFLNPVAKTALNCPSEKKDSIVVLTQLNDHQDILLSQPFENKISNSKLYVPHVGGDGFVDRLPPEIQVTPAAPAPVPAQEDHPAPTQIDIGSSATDHDVLVGGGTDGEPAHGTPVDTAPSAQPAPAPMEKDIPSTQVDQTPKSVQPEVEVPSEKTTVQETGQASNPAFFEGSGCSLNASVTGNTAIKSFAALLIFMAPLFRRKAA